MKKIDCGMSGALGFRCTRVAGHKDSVNPLRSRHIAMDRRVNIMLDTWVTEIR